MISGIKIDEYGVEHENKCAPLSFSVFLGELNSIITSLDSSIQSERNIYNFIQKCTSIMPGFPGGGRSFVKIPIHCNLVEWPIVMISIRTIFNEFRDSFKYNQNFTHFKDFIKIDKRGFNTIKNVDFLTCLPENGGSPQIDIAFEYSSRNTPVLILIVDSYWQQSIELFKEVYSKCAEYCFNVETKSKFDSLIPKGFENLKIIYDDVKTTLKHQTTASFFASIYKRSDPNLDVNANRIKKNLHFISANFSYCEYMSFLHRNAILTKLVDLISQIKNGLDHSILPDHDKIFSDQYTLPSLSQECCDILKKQSFNMGETPIYIRLIDKLYIHDALHSTIRYVKEYGDQVMEIGIYLEKRVFEKRDFVDGNVFVFYGSSEGGFYNNIVKSQVDIALMKPLTELKFSASKNLEGLNSESIICNLNMSNIYVSRSIFEIVDQGYELRGDVLIQPWMQWDSVTRKSSQKTFGISFSDFKSIGPTINLETFSRQIIPFQPFFEELNFSMNVYSIENTFLLESAIFEILKRIFDEYEIRNLKIKLVPIILSLWASQSLESFTLEELIAMQRKVTPPHKEKKKTSIYTDRVIIASTHIKEVEAFKQGKEGCTMNFVDKIYGDKKSSETASSSLAIRKSKKMYNRSFTEVLYSYTETHSEE